MAKAADFLAKSTTPPTLPLRCEYLFHGCYDRGAAGTATNRHVHPFWHVDCVRGGLAEVRTDAGDAIVEAGECVVIPAGVAHAFHYPQAGASWVSVKCEVTGPLPDDDAWCVPASYTSAGILSALEATLPTAGPANEAAANTAGHLLEALLAAEAATHVSDPRPALQRTVEACLHRYADRPVSVGDLAAEVGYSASHLSARFRRETGMGLKSFIDSVRADLARQRLRYSDESVSAIAAALGFADIYGFSRFFRRMTGQCPTRFRKEELARAGSDPADRGL